MTLVCTQCHTEQPPDNAFCGHCGQSLTDAKKLSAVEIEPSLGTRRSITVLFADLVDSSKMVQLLDPEQFQQIIRQYEKDANDIIDGFGGAIFESQGDGIIARFDGIENSAEAAVRAGLSLIESIKLYRPIGNGADRIHLQVRIGIASGDAYINHAQIMPRQPVTQVTGKPTFLAARLQGIAKPNQLVISHDTHLLVPNGLSVEAVDNLDLKGFKEIKSAWIVTAWDDASLSFNPNASPASLTPLTGRKEVLNTLRFRWKQAKKGHGQMVFLRGQPGVGKSRIVVEFERLLNRRIDRHIQLNYQCSRFSGGAPLYPIMQQFVQGAGIFPEDDEAVMRDKIGMLLNSWEVSSEKYIDQIVPLLFSQYGSSSNRAPTEDEIENGLQACTVLPFMFTRRYPVLVLVEDIQWADDVSKMLLARSIERVAKYPMMIIATARPEYIPQQSEDDYLSSLNIKRLPDYAARDLLDKILIGHSLSSNVVGSIIQKCEGVPFYLEELTLHLLAKNGNGKNGRAAQTLLPSTLFDSLIGRVDRMSIAVQQLLRIASAQGKSFSLDIVAALAERTTEDIAATLQVAVESELIFPGNRPQNYHFRHMLQRDAIYDSTSNRRKYYIHKGVGDYLSRSDSAKTAVTQASINYHQGMAKRYKVFQ